MLDLTKARRVVVKVGSSSLTHENGKLNLRRIERLVRTLSDIKNFGREVILVTSGAVATGVARLGLCERPRENRVKQACAAVGQVELMNLYGRFFSEYGHTVAQLLRTRDAVNTPERKENDINTFNTLLELGAVPIVNENDTVSTYEIEYITAFGDNDTLAATCACLLNADLLMLLSDYDGLYDSDPRQNEDARRIPVVRAIDDELCRIAGSGGSSRGTGGMATKLNAARMCLEAKIPMVIAAGENPDVIAEILNGRHTGTVFIPEES